MTEPEAFPDPGELPVIDWVSKDLIDVDRAYQRPEDTARAEKIARSFSWSKFGAVVLAPSSDDAGRYVVLDGQHRMIAAKMHPKVDHLPAVVMPGVKGVSAEANSFIGLNADRKSITSLDLYHARLAADDAEALALDAVIRSAGASVPRYPGAKYKPGETVSISVVQGMVARRGDARTRSFLEILVKADLAPIKAEHLKAAESLMAGPEFAGQIDGEDLTATILSMGAAAETQAKAFAATHCVPAWKGLASTWFQKCRKRRGSAKLPEQIPPASKSAETSKTEKVEAANLFQNGRGRPASGGTPRSADTVNVDSMDRGVTTKFRTIVPHATPAQRVVTSAVLGDPAPGRSALDQRGRA